MNNTNSRPRVLDPGQEFEKELFGISSSFDLDNPPKYLTRSDSVQEVTQSELYSSDDDNWDRYNPIAPNWGKTNLLWSAVKYALPRYVVKESRNPLNLYISVGKTLDYWHGVDAFFWWKSVMVTLDASTTNKHQLATGRHHLKADFLVRPRDLTGDNLKALGVEIALLLKERNHDLRYGRRVHEKQEDLHIVE